MSTKVQHLDKLFEKAGIVPRQLPPPVSSINMHSKANQRSQYLHQFIDKLRLRQKLIDQKTKFLKDNPNYLAIKLVTPKQPNPPVICTIEPPILPPTPIQAYPKALQQHLIVPKTSIERCTTQTSVIKPISTIKLCLPSLSSICDVSDSIFDHVRRGDFEKAKKFLLSGGDPNLCDHRQRPLVHLAIDSLNESMIELFIDHPKLDLDKVDGQSKQTALHLTVINQNLKFTQKLLHLKHSVDTQDINGQTPLHLACFLAHYDLIGCLLRYGASSRITDQMGRTPFQFLRVHSIANSVSKPVQQNIVLKCQPNKPAELVLKIRPSLLTRKCK